MAIKIAVILFALVAIAAIFYTQREVVCPPGYVQEITVRIGRAEDKLMVHKDKVVCSTPEEVETKERARDKRNSI